MATGGIEHRSAEDHQPKAIARLLVPIGMGVLTWLVVLLAGAAVLSMNSVSFLSIFVFAALAVLFVPVYRFRPWEGGLTERFLGYVDRRRVTLAVAVGLFVLVRLPVVSDLLGPVLGVLLFPLRAVPQILYGVRVFYAGRVAEIAGKLLFDFGRLYVEFLWLYTVAAGISYLLPRGGE